MVDQKTSLLINRQVPEFVREEHPNFIAFLEAYYEFLENKQGTEKNDLIAKAKDLRYISDVDESIDEFQTNFFNTYASLVPTDVEIGKATLIKHILPIYLAKGNRKSFELLFRLLYGEEVEIVQPKSNVLRASDGKWLIENAFRISQNVYSKYTGNGTKTIFKLAQIVNSDEITVYVNGVQKTFGTDYFIRKETRKLVFNTAPANNAEIKVLYDNFDFEILTNRKLTGNISGASALIERTTQKSVGLIPVFELYINSKTLIGEFTSGETARTDVIDQDDGTLIDIEVFGLSNLRVINVVNGGASYNVGDTIVISGGGSTRNAVATVSETFSGFINQIRVLVYGGGAGFKVGSNVYVVGTGNTQLTLAIDGVDVSGQNSANVFVVNTDRILDHANTVLSVSDYNFPNSVITNDNINSKIVDVFGFANVTSIGPITNVAILYSNTAFGTVPVLDADSAPYFTNGTTQYVESLHSIGRIAIYGGGENYKVGDEIIFTNPPGMYLGLGAAAAVTKVSSSGAIEKIEIQPARIAGTANTFGNSNVTVLGTGTYFQQDLRIGDRIMINNEPRYINSISSNTSLNVNVNFNYATTSKPIGKFGDYPIGGQNYKASNLPSISINSATGSNANIAIIAIMGDGENLFATSDKDPGTILKIRIIDAGEGFQFAPPVDLTGLGNGQATANAEVESSYITFPGRWPTSDSILSSSERVIQGREYYVDYSYVLSSSVEFSKFKEVFRNLIHPAGFINYAEYKIINTVETPNISRGNIIVSNTVSGTVNVNNSIYVVGTNTKFNISNNNGLITIGSKIAVNSQIRYINAIYSNTVLTVNSAFSISSNDETLTIVT